MKETKNIIRKVCLDPKYLTKDYKNPLFEKIVKDTTNECSKEDGYILSIIRIVNILDNIISSANYDIVFTVEIEIEILKPKIGDILCGTVCMIFNKGIFLDVNGKMKVLITIDSLSSYKFDEEKAIYVKETNTIKQGDIINVKIKGIQYTNKEYNSYGEIIEEE